MALKTYKATNNASRQLVGIDRSELHKGAPVKALTEGKKSTGGRNNHGHITSRRRGGGHKQAYRLIDFKRKKLDMPATVERLEYDPNRTAFIALIKYTDGELAYILAPQRLAVGDTVMPILSRATRCRLRICRLEQSFTISNYKPEKVVNWPVLPDVMRN